MEAIDEYWDLVDRLRAGHDAGAVAAALIAELRERDPDEILRYHRAASALLAGSYSWPLWHAAYQINGGCSDDGFDYFRGWLLSQGRAVYEAACADPDSLAGVPAVRAALTGTGPDLEDEDMQGATGSAYKARTGEYPPATGIRYPALGHGWDFEDDTEFATRLPRLYALAV